MGNDLNNVTSLAFTCNDSKATKVTITGVTPLAGTSNSLASLTVPGASLTGLQQGTQCGLSKVTPKSGKSFTWSGAPLSLFVRSAAPVLSPPTPNQLEAAFPPTQAPTVRVAGTSLGRVSPSQGGVTQVMCSGNWVGQFPIRPSAVTSSQVSFIPQSLPAQTCAVLLNFTDGSSALVPDKQGGYLAALTYTPWVTGRIRIQVTNNSDVPDSQLFVGVVADASGGGRASGFSGVNLQTVTSVAFTGLTNLAGTLTYTAKPGSAAGGSAYFDIEQPLASGVIYLSNQTLNNQSAPNPQTSNVRYAMAEFTYKTGFFTDLTLIDQIGFAMSSRLYTDLSGTEAITNSRRTTGCLANLVTQLQDIVPAKYWTAASSTDSTGGVIGSAARLGDTLVTQPAWLLWS